MSTRRRQDITDEDNVGLWPPDFTTVLVVVVLGAILIILTFELWHTHFGSH